MDNRQKRYLFLGILLAGCVVTSFVADWLGSAAWLSSGVKQTSEGKQVGRQDGKLPAGNPGMDQPEKRSARGDVGKSGQNDSGHEGKLGLKMLIYVSGAVVEPGMYELAPGARAQEAIDAAGGLRQDADLGRVNLAKKLRDGMQVHVPAQKGVQRSSRTSSAAAGSAVGLTGGVGGDAVWRNQADGYASRGQPERSTYDGGDAGELHKVNINTADAAELQSLPGIGPAMAQRIVEARRQGRFYSVEDLRRVKGIGKAKLEQLRAYVEVR